MSGTSFHAINAQILQGILTNPFYGELGVVVPFPIGHIGQRQVYVGEEAFSLARNPSSSQAMAANDRIQELLSSNDPADRQLAQQALSQISVATIVNKLSCDGNEIAKIRYASSQNDAQAMALRQAILASKIADQKSTMIKLAQDVTAGDKKAISRAKRLFQRAMTGDLSSVLGAQMFTEAKRLVPRPTCCDDCKESGISCEAPATTECSKTPVVSQGQPVPVTPTQPLPPTPAPPETPAQSGPGVAPMPNVIPPATAETKEAPVVLGNVMLSPDDAAIAWAKQMGQIQ